jgi:hypothetical protein
MNKSILVGAMVSVFAMSNAHAAISANGINELLEGTEQKLRIKVDEGSEAPTLERISGASVQILDPVPNSGEEGRYSAEVTADEVDADMETTIRIIAGSEMTDFTFTVKNEAEPEQAYGKTVAHCTFFHNYNGHYGFAGSGTFSFDKRTVRNFIFGSPGPGARNGVSYVSTTRAIDAISFSAGLSAFTESGDVRVTQGVRDFDDAWYFGSGYPAGQEQPHSGHFGGSYRIDDHWSTRALSYQRWMSGPENTDIWFSGENSYTNDYAASGRWAVEFTTGVPHPTGPDAYSKGDFYCYLADEVFDQANSYPW